MACRATCILGSGWDAVAADEDAAGAVGGADDVGVAGVDDDEADDVGAVGVD